MFYIVRKEYKKNHIEHSNLQHNLNFLKLKKKNSVTLTIAVHSMFKTSLLFN